MLLHFVRMHVYMNSEKCNSMKILNVRLTCPEAQTCKGLAKLGTIVAETLLCAQMLPSLATHETLLRMLQGRKCCIRNTCFLV